MKIKTMKINKGLSILLIGVLMLMGSCTGNQKKQIAQDEFCNHLKAFVHALENLDEANMGTDMNAVIKAYDKADKDWTKLINSAEKLEDVEINASVNAYNKLADKVDKIASKDTLTDDDIDEIAGHINSTADQIDGLLTTECTVK